MTNPATDEPEPSALEQRAREDLPYSAHDFGRWIRARLIEHWCGQCFWRELDRGDFGLLAQPIHPNHGLVLDIVTLIMTGSENLSVIAWALETGRPLDDVITILAVLDVNARRLSRFPWMVNGTPDILPARTVSTTILP